MIPCRHAQSAACQSAPPTHRSMGHLSLFGGMGVLGVVTPVPPRGNRSCHRPAFTALGTRSWLHGRCSSFCPRWSGTCPASIPGSRIWQTSWVLPTCTRSWRVPAEYRGHCLPLSPRCPAMDLPMLILILPLGAGLKVIGAAIASPSHDVTAKKASSVKGCSMPCMGPIALMHRSLLGRPRWPPNLICVAC